MRSRYKISGMIRWGFKNQRSPYGSWMSKTVFFLSIGNNVYIYIYIYMFTYFCEKKEGNWNNYYGLINLIPAVQLFTPLIRVVEIYRLTDRPLLLWKRILLLWKLGRSPVVDKERKQSLFKNQWMFDDFSRSGKRWACWRLINPRLAPYNDDTGTEENQNTCPDRCWLYACPLAGNSGRSRLLHIS